MRREVTGHERAFLPMAPAGSVQEQVTQQYAYLVQMAQQLNLALGQLEALGGGAGEASARRQANGRLGTAASETADGQYETLRSMILKTADQVQKTTAALTAKLEEICGELGLRQLCGEAQRPAGGGTGGGDAVLQLFSLTCRPTWRRWTRPLRTISWTRRGISARVSCTTTGAAPVYGVAVGQDLTCKEVDGEKVVEQNNFRAVFTATRLSFWQDATEVAYVSNNRLYITNITVLGGIDVGQWSMEAAEGGLAFRWIGG